MLLPLLLPLLLFFLSNFPILISSGACNVLYQLDDMSYCRIGQTFEVYKTYGCTCSGIAPSKPIDGIDKCCEVHNSCYYNMINSKVCQNQNAPFYCMYKWQCEDKNCMCDNANCKCLQSVCECDQQFIDCLAKYPYPNYARKCPYYPENARSFVDFKA